MSSYEEMQTRLAPLHIPEPRDGAIADILQTARANPRRMPALVASLRRLKAYLYVPQTRYFIMAGVVALFIALGLVRQMSQQPPTDEGTQNLKAVDPFVLAEDMLLYDLDFAEYEPAQAIMPEEVETKEEAG